MTYKQLTSLETIFRKTLMSPGEFLKALTGAEAESRRTGQSLYSHISVALTQ